MNEEANQPQAKSFRSEEEQENVIRLLEERLKKHDENRKVVQDKLHEICEGLRAQISELEDRVNRELEDKFTFEDNRLQVALNELRGNRAASALQKAKAELLVFQSYEIIENKKVKHDLTTLYRLKVERRIVPELMEMRKPANIRVAGINRGIVTVQFTCFNPDEERVLSDRTIVNPARFKILLFKKDNEQESKEYPLGKNEGNNSSFSFTPNFLEAETTYEVRVKVVVEDREGEWSNEVAGFTTPEFKKCCVWKECPDDVDKCKKYSVDGKNPRVATKVNGDDSYGYNLCTIIGNTSIPLDAVTSWNIKILESEDNDGNGIAIGVAPNDINQYVNNIDEDNKCGWYFYCYDSKLWSGPPHNYRGKKYGPRKENGQYVHTGDTIGVVMDTTKGELSFALSNVNLSVAYEGIPLDKPLVPCALILFGVDSVELII